MIRSACDCSSIAGAGVTAYLSAILAIRSASSLKPS